MLVYWRVDTARICILPATLADRFLFGRENLPEHNHLLLKLDGVKEVVKKRDQKVWRLVRTLVIWDEILHSKMNTSWWFQIFFDIFCFHPYLGKMIPFLTSIFFRWVETTSQMNINHFTKPLCKTVSKFFAQVHWTSSKTQLIEEEFLPIFSSDTSWILIISPLLILVKILVQST